MIVVGKHSGLYSTAISKDAQRGKRATQVYTGTLAAMEGIAAQIDRLVPLLEYQIEPVDPPLYRIIIRAPDAQDGSAADVQSTWELLSNAVQKDVFEHPISMALPLNILGDLHAFVDSGKTEIPVWIQFDLPDLAPPDAFSLFDLLDRGTRHYQSHNYVLRHTQTVSEDADIEIAFAHTGLIFTTADISPGGTWDQQIPTTLLWSTKNIIPFPFTKDDAPDGYAWGWLKQSPQVDQVAGNKWRIQDEWWFDLWSTFLYPTADAVKPPVSVFPV